MAVWKSCHPVCFQMGFLFVFLSKSTYLKRPFYHLNEHIERSATIQRSSLLPSCKAAYWRPSFFLILLIRQQQILLPSSFLSTLSFKKLNSYKSKVQLNCWYPLRSTVRSMGWARKRNSAAGKPENSHESFQVQWRSFTTTLHIREAQLQRGKGAQGKQCESPVALCWRAPSPHSTIQAWKATLHYGRIAQFQAFISISAGKTC